MAGGGARAWARLLLTLAAYGCGAAGQYWLTIDPRWQQSAYAWGAALVLFLFSYFVDRSGRELPAREEREFSPRSEWLLLAAVLAVGAFFSFYGVGEFPPGLNHDSAWEGMYAIRILNGEPYTPYAIEAWGRETLTFYFRAASIWLLGPTRLAVIAPGMVLGFLTLPFFYWWARNMFGTRFALVATLLLAVSGWHMVFSRTGWRSDFQPFFTVFTCCFFIRGMLTARPLDFICSGVGLALAVNVYNAARVFPLLFPAWLLAVWLQSWTWRGFLRRYGVPLLAMAVAFAVVVGPLAWFAFNHWGAFQSRLAALRGQSTLGDALKASLLLFNLRGNGDDFFVAEPALEYPPAILFVFGLLWTVLKCRDERAQFLLLGFIIGFLPGLVSRPNLNRDIGTMPFVYFFVALGAVYGARQLWQIVPRIGRFLGAAALSAICVAAGMATYSQYFGPQARSVWGFYPETTVVGEYIDKLVPDYLVWVGGDNYPRDALTYLSYQGTGHPERRNYTWVEHVDELIHARLRRAEGKGLAFVLSNDFRGQTVFRGLSQRYPVHTFEDLRYPAQNGPIFARALLVPPEGSEVPLRPEDTPSLASAPAGKLREPRGVAMTPEGQIYVCDFGYNRIQQFAPDLTFVRQWGATGAGPGQFREPCGIAVAADGVVFVADTWNHRIQAFSPEGQFLRQSETALYGARALAVGPGDQVFVADTGNNRVVRLSANLKLLGTWGAKGSGPGEFLEPTGIAVDRREGEVLVADNGNGRLQRFANDGKFMWDFAVPGWRLAAFSEPQLSVDPKGRIWVTVPAEREVRIYDDKGTLVRTFAERPPAAGGFDKAMGVAADARGGAVATDLEGRLVRLEQ
jgi:DNA-binding beta-propeller fold protein YncE